MRRTANTQSPERDFARWRRESDATSLERVFDQLAPELLIVAAHVAGRGAAEDLVQTTFLLAIDRAETWDQTRRLLPWLVGILVKQSLKEKARAGRAIDADRITMSTYPGPETEAERLELAQCVATALEDLPLHYRQVLTLRLVHGLEPTAIAHALGAPVATVKSRLQRGLARLRDALPSGLQLPASLLIPLVSLGSVREVVLSHALSKAVVASAAASTTFPLFGVVLMMKVVATVACVALIAYLGVSRLGAPEPEGPTSAAGKGARSSSVEPTQRVEPAGLAAVDGESQVRQFAGATSVSEPGAVAGSSVQQTRAVEPASMHAKVLGRVVDERGEPLPGVDVLLGDQRFDPFRDVHQFLSQAPEADLPLLAQGSYGLHVTTGEDGRFEFDRPGPGHAHLVVAWSARRGGRGVELTPDGEIEIVLPIDAVVRGVVRSSADGATIERAMVQVWPAKSGHPIAFEGTDADGAYELQRLPPGEYRVSVDRDGFAEHNASFALLGRQPHLDLDMELDPLPKFEAQLIDAEGSPWTLSRLSGELGADRAQGARWAVSTTDAPVARRGEMEAEPWRVQWMAIDSDGVVAGFVQRPEAKVLAVWRGSEKVLQGTIPDFRVGAVTALLTERATVGLQVRVQFDPPVDDMPSLRIAVTDPSGFGQEGVPILERTTTTRESTLLVPAQFVGNQCGLSVESDGYAGYQGRLTVPDGTADLWHEVVLSPPAMRLAGSVVGPSGAPVAKARIMLVDAEGRAFLPRSLSSTSTGIDGGFAIEGLPARSMLAMVSAPNMAIACFPIRADGTGDWRLALRKPREFPIRLPSSIGAGQIRVLDAKGRPQMDDRISGSMRYGGASLLLNGEAASVEIFDAATGELVARGDMPAAGELVLEPVD